VLDYAAKVALLRMIPVAVDWWANHPTSITTTGTSENLTYPDRIEALIKLQDWLRAQTRGAKLSFVDGAWVLSFIKPGGSPRVSHKSTNKITPDPWLYPPVDAVPIYVGGSGLLVVQGDPLPW